MPDVRRKLELWLDPALLHTQWDSTWNQWKHLLRTKIEVDAPRVKYFRCRRLEANHPQPLYPTFSRKLMSITGAPSPAQRFATDEAFLSK
jgi:hypothetical protein